MRTKKHDSFAFPLTQLLVRTSTKKDKFVFVIASLISIATGVGFPLLPVLFARTISKFSLEYNPNFGNASLEFSDTPEAITQEVQRTSQIMIGIGLLLATSTFIMAFLQIKTARNVASRIRKMYFEALIRQEMSWYYVNSPGSLTSKVSSIDSIESTIGQTMTDIMRDVTITLVGFSLAFFNSWKMTLVIFSFLPVIAIVGGLVALVSNRHSRKVQSALGDASSSSSDTFSSIRTVLAFEGKDNECSIYNKSLVETYKYQVRRAVVNGFGTGFLMLVLMSAFSVGFIIGNRLVSTGQVRLDKAIAASAMVPAVFSTFRIANSQRKITTASVSASYVLDIISRLPKIDPLSEKGKIIPNFQGGITFDNVSFRYEEGKESEYKSSQTLQNLSFEVLPGSLVGLCGSSGSGKSTIVSLIQRLYDVQHGSIFLDGTEDLRNVNLRWLRSQIGHVGQNPTLFQGTIKENIELGIPDFYTSESNAPSDSIPFENIVKAAKISNAHDFIMSLPNGYETYVGEGGTQLSGGQKQRICIARAIISDPKILLLDESTANLDNESEAVVQEALFEASKNRTTFIVAHRLGTIRRSDTILVLNNGSIVENGNHAELSSRTEGFYFNLMRSQTFTGSTSNQKSDSDRNVSIHKNNLPESKRISRNSKTGNGKLNDLPHISIRDASKRLFRMHAKGKRYILLGALGSAILGIAWPLGAACISELLVLGDVSEKPGQLRLWASLLVCCGVAAFFGILIQNVFLSISAERLTKEAKNRYFESIISQDMSFFDKEDNNVGSLVFRLNDQVSHLRSLTVDIVGSFTLGLASISVGVFLACFYCWRVALVAFIFMPGIVMSGFPLFRVGPDYKNPQVVESVRIASETVHSIQTVFSLGKEEHFLRKYNENISEAQIKSKREFLLSLLASAYIAMSPFCLFGAAFWQGSIVLESGKCDLLGMNKATLCIFLGSVLVGELTYSVPNFTRSRIAASDFFKIIDMRKKQLNAMKLRTNKTAELTGSLKFSDLEFSYPSRPSYKSLQAVSTGIELNKTLAFVGSSGSGKSTALSLLIRFYSNWRGTIAIDNVDITELDIPYLRSHLGLVEQEPRLFNRSIRDNIAYGICFDKNIPVTQSEVERAAKIADCHEFIEDLPEKYDTVVGSTGSTLSGGQRQRIAIARALVRNPKILMLDEATSALDSKTEEVVQENLREIRCTRIVVAHRLSTIRNADRIVVFDKGKIVEQGTHKELMKLNQAYARLLEAGEK